MAGSLRDQLVKAGLATTNQAKKAERQARAEQQAQRHGSAAPDAAQTPAGGKRGKAGRSEAEQRSATARARALARERNAEKAEKDRLLAQAANAKAAAKALRAEIKQIAQQNDQRTKTASDDDVPYNFVHGKKIKRIYITREQQGQLSTGSLVIINDDGRYHLVSNAVAEQIRARDPKRIIAAHTEARDDDTAAAAGPDDEYYAKFKIPDDLDW